MLAPESKKKTVYCTPNAVISVGTKTSLHHLKADNFDRIIPCVLLDETSLYDVYVCDLFVPLRRLPTTTNTFAFATTVYAANILATTCISGYREKCNGRGPINACCSHNGDCKDYCMKGVNGI